MSLRAGGGVRKGGRGQERTGKHKKGMDLLSARRRREEGFVEVRKNKRGNALSRKRRDSRSSILESEDVDIEPPYCRQHRVGIPPESAHDQQEKIKEMSQHLWSEHPCAQIKSASYFRQISSTEENTPIDLVIEAGIVPPLIQFLSRQDIPTLQLEAAAILVNISAGTTEHTQALIDHSAIPHLIKLLNSPTEELREKAVLTLGNIAGDSSQGRDAVLSSGILIPLLSLLNPRSRMMMLRNATWTLANLFHPTPEIHQIEPALSVLRKLVYSNDDAILWNSCWALVGLFGGRDYRMEDIFGEGNICSRLAVLIMHTAQEVQMVALKAVVNISAGDDSQAQLVIDNEMLPSLLHILTHHHHHHHHHHHESSIRRVACRVLSNIAAGNKSQVQSVIDSNMIPTLVSVLKNDEFDVKRESAWALLNATSGGTFEQIHFIANQGCIPLLCDLLASQDAEVVMVCLQAIENMLKVGEAEKELGSKDAIINVYAREVDNCDGRTKIENLHLHTLPSISHAAIRILERYWDGDDDGNDHDDNDNGDDDDHKEDKAEGDEEVEKNSNVLDSVDCEPSNRADNDSDNDR